MGVFSCVETRRRRGRHQPDSHAHTLIAAACASAVALALAVVVGNAMSTSSARVAASTTSDGLLTAGNVELARPDDSVSLSVDADNLYPGSTARGCFVLEYSGSVPAAVRLYGDQRGGNGLGAYVDVVLTSIDADECPDDGPDLDESTTTRGEEIFRGRLSSISADHSTYSDGVTVNPSMSAGDRLVVEASLEVVDDNRAQGRTVDFSLVFEGRPA